MPRLVTTKTLALCMGLLLAAARAADDVCQSGTCLANGDTLCDRAAGSCPPCMYAISGGYSCYGKIGNACPYPDTLTICSEAVPATRAPVTAAPATAAPVTAAPVTAAPVTAAPVTAAPVVVTTTPVATPAAASSDSADETTSETTTAPTTDDVKTSSTTTPQAASSVGTVAPSNATQSATTPSTAPVSTEAQDALTTDSKASPKDSPQVVNISIVVGALVGVVVVALFIVRRVRQRRDMPVDMGFDDLGFKSPQQGGGKEFATAPNSSRFGGDQHNQFATNTQTMTNRINFSTLEPEPMTTRTKSRHQSYASSAPSSEMEDNVSELEFSVGVGSSTRSHQYANHHEEGNAGRGRAKSRVRGIEKSLIQNHYPELVGSYNSDVGSIACSERSDDFDIVDPGAIRPGERRNTETLVADGRFRQFSTASLAESYVSDASTEQSSEYSNSVYI